MRRDRNDPSAPSGLLLATSVDRRTRAGQDSCRELHCCLLLARSARNGIAPARLGVETTLAPEPTARSEPTDPPQPVETNAAVFWVESGATPPEVETDLPWNACHRSG